jgi:3-hydroxyisobutyrate dehydrogenase-like beta-hydroxyacid dehydrogenase
MRVAVLGLGRMGAPIADRLEQAGHELSVWNRSPAPTEPFSERGIHVHGAPRQAWEHADVCLTMLVDMSTIGVDSSARVAEECERRGVSFLRAPVTGNPSVIVAGNLGIIVSGPKESFDRLADTLRDIGPNVFHVGTAEEARIVKLALNLMIAGTAELIAEALVLTEKYGIDRGRMLEVMGGSAVGSPFVKYKTDPLVADDYTSTFSSSLMFKDLVLALEAGHEVATPLPVTALTQQLVQGCMAMGMADDDFMALLPRLRRDAGL